MKKLFPISLAILSLATAAASAQRNQDQRRHLRLVPLGEMPVWEEEFKDGVRVQKAAKPGDLPPSEISVKRTDTEPLIRTLSLRQISDFLSVGPETPAIPLYEGKTPGDAPWIRVPLKKTSKRTLGLLFRQHDKMNWTNTKMLMLADDLEALPLGHIRFVNVSDMSVIVKIDKQQAFAIAPGKSKNLALPQSSTPVLLGYKSKDGRIVRIFENNMRIGTRQRIQGFFYKAQGKRVDQAVKFVSIPEAYPRPPRPPRGSR